MNIQKEIKNILQKKKNKTFIKILSKNINISYDDFYKNSLQISNSLKNNKIKPGSKIMVQMENSIDYLYIIFACLIGNYTVCPVDTEIKKEKLNKIENILKPSVKIRNKKDIKYLKKNFVSNIKKKSPFIIIFTSGTTGEPKGIQISNSSYLGSAISYSRLVNYDEDSVILHFLPMYYNAGILNTFFSCFFAGSKIILIDKVSGLNIINFWENIRDQNISSFHLTPEIANSLTKINVPFDLKKQIEKIKIISTGSYLHQQIVDKFEQKYNVRILSCYGLTEIGGPLTIQNWENTFVEGSVGHHSKEVKVKVKEKGKKDHIYIKSPYLMDCYVGEGKEKIKINLEKGYFNTGDIGSYDKGELIIKGRRKDIIKKGAEIVSLPYIENIFMKNKLVDEACGISENDIDKGSKIYIFVKLKNSNNIEKSLSRLKTETSSILKRIEIPDRIIPVPSLPKTYNGKTKKNILSEIYL